MTPRYCCRFCGAVPPPSYRRPGWHRRHEPRRKSAQEDRSTGLDGRSPSHAAAFVEPPAAAHGVPTDGGGIVDGRKTHVFVHVRSGVCTRDALVVGRLS
jgi:hypothetical protein